jgi:hypothetical protein
VWAIAIVREAMAGAQQEKWGRPTPHGQRMKGRAEVKEYTARDLCNLGFSASTIADARRRGVIAPRVEAVPGREWTKRHYYRYTDVVKLQASCLMGRRRANAFVSNAMRGIESKSKQETAHPKTCSACGKPALYIHPHTRAGMCRQHRG